MGLCHTTDTHSEIFRRPRRNSRALYAGLYEFFFSGRYYIRTAGRCQAVSLRKWKNCICLIMRAGFAGREGRGRRKNILPKSCEICCNRTKAISLQIRQKIVLGLSLWVYARDAICGRRNSKKVSAAGDRPSRQAMPISTFCGGSSGRMRTFPDHARPLMALFMLRLRPASTIE